MSDAKSKSISDYDGAWKMAMKLHLAELMPVYFPKVSAEIDWESPPVWRDKELEKLIESDHSTDRGQIVDLLVELRLKSGKTRTFLLHIEIQSSKEKAFARRVHRYNSGIFFNFGIRVASLTILADLNRLWLPSRDVWEVGDFRNDFQFPICKLIERLEQDWKNEKGLAVFLARAQIAALRTTADESARLREKLALVRSIYECGYTASDLRKVFNAIDRMLQLSRESSLKFRDQLLDLGMDEEQVEQLNSLEQLALDEASEEGREEGRVEGQLEGRRLSALNTSRLLIEGVTGELSADISNRLELLPVETLEKLVGEILNLENSDQVRQWLDEHSI